MLHNKKILIFALIFNEIENTTKIIFKIKKIFNHIIKSPPVILMLN